MGKFSGYTEDTSPTDNDYVLEVDAETGLNKRTKWTSLRTWLFNQINIPAGGASFVTRASETMFDFAVAGTGVWTADSAGVNRNASMSALTCYINGRRITINAVSARTFTASKDTYIDVLDNADGTGTLVYTEVTNNAASPALAANSLRLGIIVTGATTIATAASINQGQEDRILPIASSIAYSVSDSLGNLICPRDPNRKVLGYRQVLTNNAVSGYQTGLSLAVIVPLGRKVKVTGSARQVTNGTSGNTAELFLTNGAAGAGTEIGRMKSNVSGASAGEFVEPKSLHTPASATMSYSLSSAGTGTITVEATATNPAFILVELD